MPADVGDTIYSAFGTGVAGISGSYTSAQKIGDGATTTQDVDLFEFWGKSQAQLTAVLTKPAGGASLDTYLRLFYFDPATGTVNQIAANDNAGLSIYSAISVTLSSDGVYYLGVSGKGNSSYDPVSGGNTVADGTGDYQIAISLGPSTTPVTWVSEGPTAITGGQVEGMSAQNNPVTGAVEAVVADPSNVNRIWAATVNGGIWRTTNATASSPTWTPLTDNLATSIGALELDPTDVTSNTLVAGTGRVSSGARDGGPLTGMIRTTDGGTTWTALDGSTLSGRNIVAVAARGSTILAGAAPVIGSIGTGPGLYRSTNTGASFALVSGATGSGLPAGGVFDLAADPGNLNRFYIGTASGVFRSDDAGATWVSVTPPNSGFDGANSRANIQISVSPAGGNPVYVGFVKDGRLVSVFRSASQGNTGSWVAMDLPQVTENTTNTVTGATNATPIVITSVSHGQQTGDMVRIQGATGNTNANGLWTITRLTADTFSLNGSTGNGAYAGGGTWQAVQGLQPGADDETAGDADDPASQGQINFTILADRTNANFVYVGGDRQPHNNGSVAGAFPNAIGANNFSGRLFRGDASQPSGSQWTPLTNNFADPDGTGPLAGTSPHADSRDLTFDASGNILESDDGGVYRRSSPTAATGVWTSVNGNLQTSEFYSVAYDPLNHLLFGGTQDVGSPNQSTAGGTSWEETLPRQGDGGIVEAVIIGNTTVRYTNAAQLENFTRNTYNASNILVASQPVGLQVPGQTGNILRNNNDPTVQFIDPYVLNVVDPNRIVIGTQLLYESTNQGDILTPLNGGANVGLVRAIAYGGTINGTPNPDVLYVGAGSGLRVRTAAGNTVAPVTTYPGGTVADIALDANDWRTAYVLDTAGRLWRTIDAGATIANWTELTGNLVAGSGTGRTLAVVPGASANFIVVGGNNGVFLSKASQPGIWTKLGSNLPSAPVKDIRYNSTLDFLYLGTFGRGAWAVPSFSTSFDVSPTIQSTVVNDGSSQRSMVTSLTVTFDRVVTFATTPAAAFSLVRNGDGPVTFDATASTVNGVTVVTLANFTGPTTTFGSLNDGRYTLTALANQISWNGHPFDGNGDGTPGDNYAFSDVQGLFRLYGDSQGDQAVNGVDLTAFSNTYGATSADAAYLWFMDYNADSAINGTDLTAFRINYGTILPP